MISIIAFIWITEWFMPQFSTNYLFLNRYSTLGSTKVDIFLSLLNPITLFKTIITFKKLKYLLFLLGPLCFLPFLAPWELLLTLPFWGQNLLTDYSPQFSIGTHYTAEGIPLLFFATLVALKHLNQLQPKIIRWFPFSHSSKGIAVALLLSTLVFYGRSDTLYFWRYLYYLKRYPLIEKIEKHLPPKASVSLTNALLPHFTHRNTSYLLPAKADYTVISKEFKPWPLNQHELEGHMDKLRKTSKRVVKIPPDTFIFSKN